MADDIFDDMDGDVFDSDAQMDSNEDEDDEDSELLDDWGELARHISLTFPPGNGDPGIDDGGEEMDDHGAEYEFDDYEDAYLEVLEDALYGNEEETEDEELDEDMEDMDESD